MAETPGRPDDARAARAAPTILIVDDDRDVLRATERVLEEAGFHVLTGTSAAEAIELTYHHRPALLLLDVQLPDGDGIDVARQLKGDPALVDVFVALFSGTKTSSADQAKGLAEGLADGYMVRPLSSPELLARIDAFLRIRVTQRALRESADNFHAFFDAVADIIVVGTPDGRIIYANPALEKKTGYDSADIATMHMLDLHPPELRAEAEPIFGAMFRGERDACPLPLRAKSGALVAVETRVWFGRWNGADCIFGICKDLSAEQEALQRFERLFRHSPALMAVSDLPGRRFTDVSDAWLATLGYSREEVIGRTSEELRLAVDPGQQQVIAERLVAEGRVDDAELKVRQRDGAILDGLFSGEIIESQGQRYFLTVMVDQTERRQAVAALRASEALYRSILNASPDVIAVTDLAGRIRIASAAVLAMFGYEREEQIVGRPLTEFMVPDDRERVMAEVARAFGGASVPRLSETRGLRADGSTFAAEVTGELIRDANEQPTGMVLVVRDVTERKRAEEEQRESEGKYRLLADHMTDVVWITGLDMRVTYQSPSSERFRGFTTEELRALPPERNLPPESLRAVVELLGAELPRIMADPDYAPVATLELEYYRKDGTTVWSESKFSVVRDDEGTPVSFLGEGRDITERRQAEEVLRESEAKYRLLADHTTDFVWLMDMDMTTTYQSPSSERLRGFTTQELHDLPLDENLAPESLKVVVERLAAGLPRVMADPDYDPVITLDVEIYRKDGTTLWTEIALSFVRDADRRPVAMLGEGRDITARRRAEVALTESHDLLSNLTRLVPGVVYQYRLYPDGRSAFPYSSPGINDIFECTPEEVRDDATPAFGRLHPDDAGRVGELIAESARTLEEFYCEFRVILPRQGLRWRWSQAHPERTEDGGTLWHGIISDITERKLAEEALQREQHLMRTLMENVPDHIYFKDLGSRFVRINDSLARALGLSDPGQAVGRTDFDFFTDEHARQAYEDEQEIIRTGRPNSGEERETRTDLPDTWVSTTKMPLRDIDETIIGTFGISVDITERKQTEEELQRRNAFVENLLENAPIGIAVNTIDDGQRVYVSRRFEETYGVPPGSIGSVADYFEKVYLDPAFREEMRERIMADMATGDPERMRWDDIPITTQAGEHRVVTAINIPLLDQNLMISTVQDVTERKRAEEALLQSQKMETVGRLAGGVAHDFNNLLAVIIGNAELARADLDPADACRDALTEIEDAAHRGAALTRQLLAFSRQQVVAPEVLDLDAVVGEIEGMLHGLIGADIALAFEPGEPAGRVRADRSQIGQVLMNLAVNARDAMPDGGTLTIATREVILAEADADRPPSLAPGRYVALSVTDTGTGMDAATREHLFEPFFTTKGPDKGSGLGLATAQGIARQAGGDLVCVESEPGGGSTFTLYLPATDDPLPAAPAAALVTPVASRSATILLVEDDAGVRRLGERVLAGAGYTVLVAADGAEALALLVADDGSVDLVVTDIIMPRMGGRELARRAAEGRPGARILFASGYPGDILTGDGTLPVGAAFIGKPYMPAELLAAVRDVLSPRD